MHFLSPCSLPYADGTWRDWLSGGLQIRADQTSRRSIRRDGDRVYALCSAAALPPPLRPFLLAIIDDLIPAPELTLVKAPL
jgi:hypothetical protein